MTERKNGARENEDGRALDPWMLTLARSIGDDVEVPRDMMWLRIQQQRAQVQSPAPSHTESPVASPSISLTPAHGATVARKSIVWRNVTAIAAVLVCGVMIGRYALPRSVRAVDVASQSATTDSLMQLSQPARIAMEEHLMRTVSLLTEVRNSAPGRSTVHDVSPWARELLGTTRLLLDEPSLNDARTRGLLQDLELVLMQIIDARPTAAPEVRSAPTETMRETNLLTRVRAVVTASTRRDDPLVVGDEP